MRALKAFAVAVAGLAGLVAAASTLVPTPRVNEVPAEEAAPPIPTPIGSHELTAEDVNAWLDGFMPHALQSGDVAGAVVVVVRDGQILTQRGFGYSNVERRTPVNPAQTLFRPGSISKLITWTAVMQQVEQGRIDLDADVNRYLDFEIPLREGQPITMRQIMTHTPGFEEQIKTLIGSNRDAVPSTEDQLKRWIPHRIYAPGTTPAYSNYATALAGYIVQRVSGEPFDGYVQRHIFEPLGMTHSTMAQPLPERLRRFMSTGYRRASGEQIPFEIVGPAPAGSMSSTGADMGRFMIAHLQGGELDGRRILRPETAAMMHNTALTVIPGLNRMRLGFFESNINGMEVIGHGGDTGAFHSTLHLFPAQNVGIYYSQNSSGRQGSAITIRVSLFEQFADRYFPEQTNNRRVDPATSAEHVRLLAGNWMSSRRPNSTFLNITQLLGQPTVSAGPDGELVLSPDLLLGRPSARWVEIEPWVWRDLDSHERFAALVENGQPRLVSISTASPFTVFMRPPWYKSAALLMPLLQFSLIILLLTALLWPVRALVRRHYGTTLALTGRDLWGYRVSRIAAWLILLVLGGWFFILTVLFQDLGNFAGAFDPFLVTLQLITFVVFLGGLAAFGWYAWQVWRGRRRWQAKVWSIALLFSGIVMVWIGVAFQLLSLGTNY